MPLTSCKRLAQHWTTRHRRIHWQVACMTQSMSACWWRIFSTHVVSCNIVGESAYRHTIEIVTSLLIFTENKRLSTLLNWMTICEWVVQLNIHILQSNAATDLRWCGRLYKSFFWISRQNAKVKGILKSVHICQSYHKKTACVGVLFWLTVLLLLLFLRLLLLTTTVTVVCL